MSLLEGRLNTEIAVYYSDYTDYQIVAVPPPPAPPLTVTSNAGDVVVQGIDFKLAWAATEGLSLGMTGNYNDGEFVKIEALPGTSPYDVGDTLPESPKYQFSLWAEQEFTLMEKPTALRLDYNQRGSSTFRNRRTGDFYTGTSDVMDMLNFRFSHQWSDKVSLGVFGKNLLNDRGLESDLVGFESRPRPRSFGADISFNF